ncbi:MAG: tRNA pseudouridine(54/55) synthase Pus10 [Halobacteriota archaeon]
MDVLAVAAAARETGPVCDACLGRCVADRSRGLSNRERGRTLRIALALAEDGELADDPGETCWVCEGITQRYDELADRAVDALSDLEFETYQVGTRPSGFVAENDRLLREDARGDPEAGEPLKRECNREVGKRLGERTGTRVDFERPDVLVLLDLAADAVEVTVNSAFVYGRYRKLERGIPQTRWPCSACDGTGRAGDDPCHECGGSGYRYDRSVEQLVAPHVREAMDGEDAAFHGAGREDVDARMLGTGRPFVVEVDSPRRRRPDLEALERTINEAADGAVEVEGLRHARYTMVEHVKELEAGKTYEVDVTFAEAVDPEALAAALAALSGATVEQRTPRRVDHRRADLVRERSVYDAGVVEHDGDRARVRIHGAGGLYVKELLHGDGGRTEPNLADLLGVAVDVEALDVVAVEAEGDTRFADGDHLLDDPSGR